MRPTTPSTSAGRSRSPETRTKWLVGHRWARAAGALARGLATNGARPEFRRTLNTFVRSATRLASRTQATAEDPAAWARVFADLPGDAPDTNPHPEAITPDPAQTAAGSPDPGAAPARNQQGGQDSDEPGHMPPPPAATSASSPAPPADTTPALPAACRSVADLRQLAAAHGLGANRSADGRDADDHRARQRPHRPPARRHQRHQGRRPAAGPGEVPAYLAAYARHPQLPPRCLADLARHDPGGRAASTLTAAREIAARHGLEVRIRRAGGQCVHHLLRARHRRHARAELPGRDRQRPPRAVRGPGRLDQLLPSCLPRQRGPGHVRGPGGGTAGLGAAGRPAHPAPGRRRRQLHPDARDHLRAAIAPLAATTSPRPAGSWARPRS